MPTESCVSEEYLGACRKRPCYLNGRTLPEVQEAAESFEQLAAYGAYVFPWTSPDGAKPWGAAVSPALLRLLGARPHLGRLFTDDDAQVGADGVVLLSHDAWTRRFGANPDIVGTIVEVADEPHTVVGVLADGFRFPSVREELWTPYVIPAGSTSVVVLGRLRAGVSPEQAATEVRTILQRMEARRPRAGGSGRTPWDTPEIDARVIPLQEEMTGAYRPAVLALTGATAVVLLVACVNVAGLSLARGAARQRALAVCAALGAGRGRIVRQLLTESVVLSLGGGLLGLAASVAVLGAVPVLVPGDVARLEDVGLDGVALAFTLGLVGAGLLLRSFFDLVTVDRGYDPANVIAAGTRYPIFRLSPPGSFNARKARGDASTRRSPKHWKG